MSATAHDLDQQAAVTSLRSKDLLGIADLIGTIDTTSREKQWISS